VHRYWTVKKEGLFQKAALINRVSEQMKPETATEEFLAPEQLIRPFSIDSKYVHSALIIRKGNKAKNVHF